MQIESACVCCQTPLDYHEHHPSLLDKCGHVICNKCKLIAVTSEEDSGYIMICCPICNVAQESIKEHDTKIIQICEKITISLSLRKSYT